MGLQVEELTRGREPWEKEFIDFSFNGKHISEFGLVAVSDGDRLSLDASPSFSDETSTVNGLSGQYYWGTTFDAGKKTFKLATDGMTEKQVAAFKKHFLPGHYGKLVLDEKLGRYCYARVSSVSTISFIPFQETIIVAGGPLTTNIYKGESSLTFQMDYPFWMAETNVVDGSSLTEETVRKVYANNIPLSNSTHEALTIQKPQSSETSIALRDIYAAMEGTITIDADANVCYGQSSTVSTQSRQGVMVRPLYNPSEIASPAVIKMTSYIFTTEQAPYYISFARDSFNNTSDRKYSMLFVYDNSGIVKNVMKFTNPAVFYYINNVISLAYSYKDAVGANLIDFQEKLQEEIHHPAVLSWAMAGLRFIATHSELYNSESGAFSNSTVSITDYRGTQLAAHWYEYLNHWMLFFAAPANSEGTDKTIDIAENTANSVWLRDGSLGNFFFEFNGQNCQSFITYSRHQVGTALTTVEILRENCGEMVLSGYLKIEGSSTLDDDLNINIDTCCFLGYIVENAFADMADITSIEYNYLYL